MWLSLLISAAGLLSMAALVVFAGWLYRRDRDQFNRGED